MIAPALAPSPQNFEELQQHIHQQLCACENLLPDQFQLQAFCWRRAGRPCGWQFVLQGPRQVRLTAIWACESNHVYYYNARGERFHKEKLAQYIRPPAEPRGSEASPDDTHATNRQA
ncbi:MAG: hypothetical protein KatS3mg114_1333 [Planctomycetaceae bacterium]|nr:MAG: hypothetical protein KatS3mg114_1333 [Planctomycetaceae bacterium]